jgi:hypothetical protein
MISISGSLLLASFGNYIQYTFAIPSAKPINSSWPSPLPFSERINGQCHPLLILPELISHHDPGSEQVFDEGSQRVLSTAWISEAE